MPVSSTPCSERALSDDGVAVIVESSSDADIPAGLMRCPRCFQPDVAPHERHMPLRLVVQERVAPHVWVPIALVVRLFAVPAEPMPRWTLASGDPDIAAGEVLDRYRVNLDPDAPVSVAGRALRVLVLPPDPVDGDDVEAALAVAGGAVALEDQRIERRLPDLAEHGDRLSVPVRLAVEIRVDDDGWRRVASRRGYLPQPWYDDEPSELWETAAVQLAGEGGRVLGPMVRVLALPDSLLGGGGPAEALRVFGGVTPTPDVCVRLSDQVGAPVLGSSGSAEPRLLRADGGMPVALVAGRDWLAPATDAVAGQLALTWAAGIMRPGRARRLVYGAGAGTALGFAAAGLTMPWGMKALGLLVCAVGQLLLLGGAYRHHVHAVDAAAIRQLGGGARARAPLAAALAVRPVRRGALTGWAAPSRTARIRRIYRGVR